MANSNGWGDGAANNAIGWGQGANNSISWGKSHSLSNAGLTDIVGLTTDADAQAFITAAAITDATQQSAIDTLVKGLKTDGVWTKMKAIYPFVGGTASTHKWNLKDPRDLDAAFRLVFNGGWTHSSTGATPNGTNGYADTKLMPSSVLSSGGHFSYYSRTDKNNIVLEQIGGNSSNGHIALVPRYLDSVYYSFQSAAETQITTIANSLNLHINNRNGGNQQFHKSGVKLSDVTVNASPMPTVNIYLGTINNNGTPLYFSSMQTAFSSIGDGLTDTDASNLYTRVQTYQTALSRNV
jgi:hypothetical protein